MDSTSAPPPAPAPTAAAETAVEPGPPTCLQCGTERVGDYCHVCGQHHSVADRLTFRSLWTDFRVRRLSLDRGLFRTLADVVVRPGTVARAFVEGRRQTYTHPITLLFVLYAVYAVVFGVLDEPFQEMMRRQIEGQLPAGEDLPAEMEVAMTVIGEAMRVFYTYGAYFSVLIILPFAFLVRWLLGLGRTVAECAVLGAYVEAAVVLPSALVITPLGVLTGNHWIGMTSFALYLGYGVWGTVQFVGDRRPGTMALAALSMTVAQAVYIGLFAALAFAVGVYVGVQQAHGG